MGMVRFGLRNVKYAKWDETQGTYGTYKPIPGAVSLNANFDGSFNDFRADDIVFATIPTTVKETGSIEFAALTPDMEKDLFGYEVDATTGLTYKTTDPVNDTFALSYEVQSNGTNQRGVRYNVSFSNPSQSANTMTDSTTPDTVTANFIAIGRNFVVDGVTKNILKGHVDEGLTGYDTFFDAVVIPGATA